MNVVINSNALIRHGNRKKGNSLKRKLEGDSRFKKTLSSQNEKFKSGRQNVNLRQNVFDSTKLQSYALTKHTHTDGGAHGVWTV